MRSLDEIEKDPRIYVNRSGPDGGNGWAVIGGSVAKAPAVVWSNGGGWDHVSVSFANRCPTLDEMCKIKEIFFFPDECCVEFHPAEKDYVNIHPFCLHIWRSQNMPMPTPPRIFV